MFGIEAPLEIFRELYLLETAPTHTPTELNQVMQKNTEKKILP